jgi:hypothetical protein
MLKNKATLNIKIAYNDNVFSFFNYSAGVSVASATASSVAGVSSAAAAA